ncbi:MAG: TatD family hydrolase, partial [Victivallales bacterium]|nr:TatD family hydrolase [Victivallales bacterium]
DNVRAAIPYIPDNRLLLETDSPYLAPVPYRGRRNNPGYLIKVAEKVAAEKNISLEKCAKTTTANACELFHITR